MTGPDQVVVWGNCQAAPVAALLRDPLARAGLTVVALPPVYLLTPAEVEQVHELMTRTALLVSQPIRDEYRVPGCSTDRLAALLPDSARVVLFPLTYHGGDFPFQVTATDGHGGRPPAPLTDYHDLRVLAAAARGARPGDDVGIRPASAVAQQQRRDAATAELRRRESACDVEVSDLVAPGAAMWTLNHPRNVVLAETARRVLCAAGRPELAEYVETPEREFLGAVRTPTERPDTPVGDWVIGGRDVPWREVVDAHLAWYVDHPDVLAATVDRHAGTLRQLDLAPEDSPRGTRATSAG
ncbi:WcbI family polysaccharide biosynthesis putative acetyltransferase [Jatrophihabitans sp. YIM 134969]